MARRNRRRGRRYGRRFARAARSGGSKVMRMFGFSKGGFRVSNAVIIAGALVPAVVPAQSVANSSPIDVLTGKYNSALTMGQRVSLALASYAYTGLGYKTLLVNVHGGSPNAYTGGLGVVGVGSGVALKFAGKFINPMMAGSPVKL